MRALFWIAILVASLAPVAAADDEVLCERSGVAIVCLREGTHTTGPEDCSTFPSAHSEYDELVVFTPAGGAYVLGARGCHNDFWGNARTDGVDAHAFLVAAGAGVSWYGAESASGPDCVTYVYAYAVIVYQDAAPGCPAGAPPNPGWGRLLG